MTIRFVKMKYEIKKSTRQFKKYMVSENFSSDIVLNAALNAHSAGNMQEALNNTQNPLLTYAQSTV